MDGVYQSLETIVIIIMQSNSYMRVQRLEIVIATVLINGEISADIEGIKLEITLLQNEINRGNLSSTLFRLEDTVKSFESKQTELENIVKHREEVISNLRQENSLFQSKLTSLESLLFVLSPKTQVESNLNDEMGIQITKELSRKS